MPEPIIPFDEKYDSDDEFDDAVEFISEMDVNNAVEFVEDMEKEYTSLHLTVGDIQEESIAFKD